MCVVVVVSVVALVVADVAVAVVVVDVIAIARLCYIEVVIIPDTSDLFSNT